MDIDFNRTAGFAVQLHTEAVAGLNLDRLCKLMRFMFKIIWTENSLAIQGDDRTGDTAMLVVDAPVEQRELELTTGLTVKLNGFDFWLAFIADKSRVIQ